MIYTMVSRQEISDNVCSKYKPISFLYFSLRIVLQRANCLNEPRHAQTM